MQSTVESAWVYVNLNRFSEDKLQNSVYLYVITTDLFN